MPNTTPLLTIDEFLKLPSSECLRELVRGRVIESKLPKLLHGIACGQILVKLGAALAASDFVAITRCGVITHREPDTVRGPDLLIYPRQKLLSLAKSNDGYADFPPVVAIEVLDAGERWLDVMEKGIEYLHVGAKVVCLVDPAHQTVVQLRDHKPPQLLHAKDSFALPEVLPDFRVPVGDFFA
jgi:Uma2 family endonuclease